MLHVHFGPSPLALGLLVPASREAEFDVAIVGRPGDHTPLRYGRSISGPDGRLMYTTVQWFEGPSSFEDLSDGLRSRITKDEPLLVTCTLRDRIVDRADFVETLLRHRSPRSETVILACENAPHRTYERIAEIADETGALMLRTVVNRMCIACENDSEGRRLVSAHPLGEWLIADPETPVGVLEQLANASEVQIVPDIEARHDRKLWMVNGAHQALALMARRANYPDLPLAARDPKVAARLSHLHAAMNDALEKLHPLLSGGTGNLDYAIEHVQAYCEHPDSINRVLGQFKRARLASFFAMFDERIARPARICSENGISTGPYLAVINVLEQLLASIDTYQDAAELRAGQVALDPVQDAEALEAYRNLLSGWKDNEVEQRVQALASNLADHRAARAGLT